MGELLFKLFDRKVGGEVGAATFVCVKCPYFVAGMQEVVDDGECVDAVEGAVFDADVVEAKVVRSDGEATAVFFVVCVSVDVVVYGEVVDHLRDRDVVEEARVVGSSEVFAEALHQEGFAGTYGSLYEDVFVQFVSARGEDLFGEGASVEVVEEESQDVAVVVVDFKSTVLGGEDDVVGDPYEEFAVRFVYVGVGEVCAGDFVACDDVLCASDDVAQCEEWFGVVVFGGVEHRLVPLDVSRGGDVVLCECLFEARRVMVNHSQMSLPPKPPAKL